MSNRAELTEPGRCHGAVALLLLAVMGVLLAGCVKSGPDDAALQEKVLAIIKAQPAPAVQDEQVLEVIRKHPDVVLEALSTYQKKELKQRQEEETAALQKKVAAVAPGELVADSPVSGAPARRLMLIEFSDFECPYCGRAYQTVKQFMQEHEGEVTLVYKHLPLMDVHPQAAPAARAAWAAQQQGKFWEFHDALFEAQDKLGEQYYLQIAKFHKLDIARFNADRRGEAAGVAINKDLALAVQLGINSTPTFLLNGLPIAGAVPLAYFEKALATAKSALPSP